MFETAFSWLGEIFRAILSLIPRFKIVKSTHEGVAFIRGKNVKKISPGFIFWWPFWTEHVLYPVVRQTMNLPQQTLITKDGITVQINTIVVYTVEDIVTALTIQWDLNETIRDLSLSKIRYKLGNHTYAYLVEHNTQIDEELTKDTHGELAPYGVNIVKMYMTDFSKTTVLTLAKLGESIPQPQI
jgi:regulator of protease activity HflC (stomatin/prohibitin superfamily)